ncbi:CAP domain-containing protein [Sorangium cellulosum]|nr:CAP domain-containing protein [Sorangium cellulosum]
MNESLRVAARLHARDMAMSGYFSHESADGRTLLDRTQAAGFGGCAVGEDIAQGYRDPQAVVAGWMGSDGHCANLLSPRYRHLGVGYYDAPDAKIERVWGQNFGD